MTNTLYLLDGMALVYRAHFALIKSPIFTSNGTNTSALYGFTSTLLDLLDQKNPHMLAIAMDTPEPTGRHRKFPAYKAQREEIPEDIVTALPNIDRIAAALNIPVLKAPGFEADDIIGTLAVTYASDDLHVVMVTPDKDFAQLVNPCVTIFKPGRMGRDAEVIGESEVKEHWNVSDPLYVADILGLWGDASDNIPGVPGIGEKTAKKIIGQYGSLEGVYAHLEEFKGKQKEKLETFRDQAFLSRELATIITDVPLSVTPDDLLVGEINEEAARKLCIEFEFNSIGRRLFGDSFKAGRGRAPLPAPAQGELFASTDPVPEESAPLTGLKTLSDVTHDYRLVDDLTECRELAAELSRAPDFCFDVETDSLDCRTARLAGIAFAIKPGQAWYVNLNAGEDERSARIDCFRRVLADPSIGKTGHNLKYDLSVLAWNGIEVDGTLFDTLIAHSLIEPERRHGMDALAEQYLGYTPIPITNLIGEKKSGQISMLELEPAAISDYAAEDADITLQLRAKFEKLLAEQNAGRVFHDIEMPLLPVIIRMEMSGIRLDEEALERTSATLSELIQRLQSQIHELAGTEFNLNSPKQLGEILFDQLNLNGKPKKTRTGQYKTDEGVLSELAAEHEIARLVLMYREATKLKSTYVDALPLNVFPKTGRIHTTFSQTGAITGRLASSNPNLQNIPVRTETGREIRSAFVASDEQHVLLSADYSQIELRVMAELSRDPGMLEAFADGQDIHAATAAKVYKVSIQDVTLDMRRTAKMVNFGIIYGISAFGLSQRLGIPRKEASDIIEQYFLQYPGVKAFMDRTIEECRARGYVETLTGRRRWIRDINSSNGTIRGAAERTAINTPIQGTAADMIKLAMIRIDKAMAGAGLNSRMLLQVHDELLFDVPVEETGKMIELVSACMREALDLGVPVVVETGTGRNWLEAH